MCWSAWSERADHRLRAMGTGFEDRHQSVGRHWRDGLVLFDRKTRIAHHWEHQDPSKLAAALKLLKPRGAA